MKIFKSIFILILLFYLLGFVALATLPHDLDIREPTVKIPFEKISLFDAWKEIESKNPTFSPVTIGIVDTGVDAKHPEFAGEVIGGTLRGAVDFGSSPFFAKRDGDGESHGTQVAGIIGASNISPFAALPTGSPQTNGIIAGVTDKYIFEVRRPILPTIFSTIRNVENITENEVQIVNIGFTAVKRSALRPEQKGKIGGEVSDRIFEKAVLKWSKVFENNTNTLFIIPAGNSDTDVQSETPSNFSSTLSNVIAVGALDGLSSTDDRDITPPEGSNFGDAVVIAAPGSSIYTPKKFSSPLGFDDYDTNFLGTSASAPMVTGVAGLIKAIKPNLTPAQIKQILVETADPIQTGEPNKRIGTGCYADPNDPVNTGCRLNAEKAVCHPLVLNCFAVLGNEVLLYFGNGGIAVPFTVLQNYYDNAGFPTTFTDIFPSNLNPFRLVFLITPGSADDSGSNFFTASQFNAIVNFLGRGGHLVVMGDHGDAFGINTINDLLVRLGVDIMQNADVATIDSDVFPPLTDITFIPLMVGVNSFDGSFSSSLTVGPEAISLIRIQTGEPNAGATIVAFQEIHGGVVLVFGDANGLDDFAFQDPQGDGTGDILPFADNLVITP